MISKIVTFDAALAALAAAAGVLVVSATFALYALLRTYLGPSGAAACVTLVAALLLGGLAMVLIGKVKGPKPQPVAKGDGKGGLVERMTEVLSDRPVVAAGAAVAAGLLAWRNPALVSMVLRAMELRGGNDRGRR